MELNNIFLIGMMGAGKSTAGVLLSQKINIPYLDMDSELERLMEMSIQTILSEYGENRFRRIETIFFREITKQDHLIYATGGGLVLDDKNQKILKNKGVTIFLDCSVSKLINRLEKDPNKRPLLDKNFKNRIKRLYEDRYYIYKSCAHHKINTNNLSPESVINLIVQCIS